MLPVQTVNPKILLVSAFMLTALFAWVVAWAGALAWVASGRRLLPPAKPRSVPWGAGSVLAVFLTWLILSFGISGAYFLAQGKAASPSSLTARIGKAAGIAAKPDAPQPPAPALAKGKPQPEPAVDPRDLLVCQSIILVLLIPLTPCVLRLLSGATLADIGLDLRSVPMSLGRGVVAWLLLAPVTYGLMIGLNLLLRALDPSWTPEVHPVMEAIRADPTGRTAFLVVALAVLLAPASEELFFRGILLPWLNKTWRAGAAWRGWHEPSTDADLALPESSGGLTPDGHVIPVQEEHAGWVRFIPRPLAKWMFRGHLAAMLPNILVSAVFAGLHFPQWPAPIPLFFLSLGLGLLMQRTGSLFAPFFLHALFNGFSTMMMMLLVWANVPMPEKTAVPPPAQKAVEKVGMRDQHIPPSDHARLSEHIGHNQSSISRPPHIL